MTVLYYYYFILITELLNLLKIILIYLYNNIVKTKTTITNDMNFLDAVVKTVIHT